VDPIGTVKTCLVQVGDDEYNSTMLVTNDGVLVECPDIPGLSATADTFTEASAAILDLITAHVS
jgi:predicted RNase H-like HicB family nuclease